MKVVFSRKGFDSQYGGMPSPILPDGRLLPLPIPSTRDSATLADLDFADASLDQLLCDLSAGKHGLQTHVHFDPDLGGRHVANLVNWRPALGQTGSAQSHLSRHGIGAGDVFLFFGWFRLTECTGGKWRFAPGAPDLHVLFGWLEIDEVLPVVTQRTEVLRRLHGLQYIRMSRHRIGIPMHGIRFTSLASDLSIRERKRWEAAALWRCAPNCSLRVLAIRAASGRCHDGSHLTDERR